MTMNYPVTPREFTKTEHRIAEYIAANTEAFLFMGIAQLSETLNISEATVSRFARHVGCSDFKDLKRLVMEQNAIQGPAAKLAGTLLEGEGDFISGWMRRQQECLEKTLEGLDREEFRRAVEALAAARRVLIHGKNASGSLASLLLFRLRRLGIQVQLIPSGGSEIFEGLSQAKEGDLVVMFSFSKVSAEGRAILEYGKETGCRTLAFNSRRYAPEEERADINLYVYRGEEQEYHSAAAPSAVVDALAAALSQQLGADVGKRLERLQKLKKRFGAQEWKTAGDSQSGRR